MFPWSSFKENSCYLTIFSNLQPVFFEFEAFWIQVSEWRLKKYSFKSVKALCVFLKCFRNLVNRKTTELKLKLTSKTVPEEPTGRAGESEESVSEERTSTAPNQTLRNQTLTQTVQSRSSTSPNSWRNWVRDQKKAHALQKKGNKLKRTQKFL